MTAPDARRANAATRVARAWSRDRESKRRFQRLIETILEGDQFDPFRHDAQQLRIENCGKADAKHSDLIFMLHGPIRRNCSIERQPGSQALNLRRASTQSSISRMVMA